MDNITIRSEVEISESKSVEAGAHSPEVTLRPRRVEPASASLEGRIERAPIGERIRGKFLPIDHEGVRYFIDRFMENPRVIIPTEDQDAIREDLSEIARDPSSRGLLASISALLLKKEQPFYISLLKESENGRGGISEISTLGADGAVQAMKSAKVDYPQRVNSFYFFLDEYGIRQIGENTRPQILRHELTHVLHSLNHEEDFKSAREESYVEEHTSSFGVKVSCEFHNRAEKVAIDGENAFLESRGRPKRIDHQAALNLSNNQVQELNYLEKITKGPAEATIDLVNEAEFDAWFADPSNQFKTITQAIFARDIRTLHVLKKSPSYNPASYSRENVDEFVKLICSGISLAPPETIKRLLHSNLITDFGLTEAHKILLHSELAKNTNPLVQEMLNPSPTLATIEVLE
ncbi:MAG: hypothetical protein MRY21_06225 [Simkaniaceae bacterium]|nr:hypothetical protein [Simkaniaceae bacterium]